MFSLIDIEYCAGIKIKGKHGESCYSLDFFMREFVAYWEVKAKITKYSQLARTPLDMSHPSVYWRASQSVPTGDKPLSSIDLAKSENYVTYRINGVGVICPIDSNNYMIDRSLIAAYPAIFNKGPEISYLMLARFMLKPSTNHAALGATAITILNGKIHPSNSSPEIDGMPVLLAALLLAEPCRNPSVFLPTLMLLELIANRTLTRFGDSYSWENCIQNSQLITQHAEPVSSAEKVCMGGVSKEESFGAVAAEHASFLTRFLHPRLVGMPTVSELASGEKLTMEEHVADTFNADKKYNKTRNQRGEGKVKPHEVSMQAGGYFPASHRFSFTELEPKRAEGVTTLSDQKCFIAISDFLLMVGLAQPIHKHDLHRPKNKLDQDLNFLREAILPFLWCMQQSCLPSKHVAGHKHVPIATLTQLFRDNLQRNFISPEGPGLYPEKTLAHR